jgi:hypothetical protein
MARTILGARQALDELSESNTAAAMIEQYAGEWWKIDHSYRHFCTQLDRSGAHLDAALKWTSRIYQEYLEAVNDRFTELVTREGKWPPEGQRLGGVTLWARRRNSDRGLCALIMVDALRYELAQDLAARLELAPDQVEFRCSTAPSVTALGMAALLPRSTEFDVDYANGWVITPPGSSENLARKEKRLAWLAAQVGAVATYNLDRWLATPLHDVDNEVNWIVITSQAIDAIGEGAGMVALHTFDALLARLEHGIRRLMAVDCVEIHIVTDHGFLLREAVREADKVKVTDEGILKKQARYIVGRDLPPTDLPHLPISGSRDLVAWFPRGIGCFVTPGPYNYMHGGIALQEVVTPYIQIRRSVEERLVGVSLYLVDGPEIRNAIFKVRLVPEGVDLLTKARQVEIDVVKAGQRVSRVWEEKVERDTVERSLMLEPDYGLELDDEVQVRVRDATTGELLDAKLAIIKVDLEL